MKLDSGDPLALAKPLGFLGDPMVLFGGLFLKYRLELEGPRGSLWVPGVPRKSRFVPFRLLGSGWRSLVKLAFGSVCCDCFGA